MIDKAPERRLEILLANLLRYGSYLGCVAIGLGLLISWPATGGPATSWGTWTVSAGIALLISLPVMRLSVMFATFLKERDYRFAATAALVLIIIGISFAVGLSAKN